MRTFLMVSGLVWVLAAQASAAVAVDSVAPSSSGTAASGASSLSWSHTVTTSGSNLALVVGVGVGARPDTGLALSVSYNSVAMTSVGLAHANNTNHGFVQMFCLAAPASGTHTVAVNLSGGTADLIGGSISFTGANQSSPCGNAATAYSSGTSVSVAVTSAVGDMVVDAVGTGTSISTSNQTLRWLENLNPNTADGNAAQSTAPGASSVTMGYTGSNDYWAIVGVDVVAASGSTGGNAGPCDLNQDGVINGPGPNTDVTLAINMALGTQTCTANLEGANTCTVITVQRVVNASLGQTCITYGTHAATLSWTASTSPNISYYNVYRGTASGGPYSKIGSTTANSGTTTYKDTVVQAGQTYYYVGTAVDSSGNESGYSNQATAAIPTP